MLSTVCLFVCFFFYVYVWMHGSEEGLDVKGIVWCISSGCEYVTKHKEELSSHG